ncbi:DUF551 domain-containing protein [Cronobacter malonaticus]|uniref:DUF551 domain-containing protein n=1 Tax=Cronobacter malonaticus TaxID=413503 RepID=UPI0024AE419D|nr:DUF551 domain-containing protein [Cronobacter malonaticus]MDI6405001.1 DUF551 domain-containing protein [Cronobacter malonaticus]
MSTISNERLEEITNDKMINQGSEFAKMASELLALRKERERAEPVDDSEIKWRELALQFDGHRMQAICFLKQILKELPEAEFSSAREFLKAGPLPGEEVLRNRIAALAQPAPVVPEDVLKRLLPDVEKSEFWFEHDGKILFEGVKFNNAVFEACRAAMIAAPAPSIADDSLPYDPQIAEYEQMMEAEQAQADNTSQKFESLAGRAVVADENGNLPCPFCGGRCDPNGWMGRYDDGVPMCGPECEDCGATANSIEEWNRRHTAPASVKQPSSKDAATSKASRDSDANSSPDSQATIKQSDGWIPCSERMPEEGGRYWCYVEEINSLGKSHYQWNCSWNGEDWGGEGFYGRVTHWQPLPEPPCK